jgi:hypothetical protein
LRQAYNKQNQGIKRIPIYDKYNTHPDYEIHPRQRIWFDVPLLRYPSWQSVQILDSRFYCYIDEALEFMKNNSKVDDFAGFYDFEIAKVQRNLEFLKDGINLDNNIKQQNRSNFKSFFTQHDQRRETNFSKTFPELNYLFN